MNILATGATGAASTALDSGGTDGAPDAVYGIYRYYLWNSPARSHALSYYTVTYTVI